MLSRFAPIVVASVRERLVSLIETFNLHVAQLDTELLDLVQIKESAREEEICSGENAEADQIARKWKVSVGFLLTIPGIGLLTACWLVVTTLNFTVCETAEAAAHFVG